MTTKPFLLGAALTLSIAALAPAAASAQASNAQWSAQAALQALDLKEAAFCTAVLKQHAVDVAAAAGSRDRLVSITRSGFAFVGTILKSGMSRADGDVMLEQAEARLAKSDIANNPQLIAQSRSRCEALGNLILKQASGIERSLISYKAKQRAESLLAKNAQKSP